MKKGFALILAVLLALPCAAFTEGTVSTLTLQQRQEDIDYLCNMLERRHYDLFALVDEAAWAARVADLSQAASQRSDLDFCLSLMELVASLGDSHTRAGLTGAAREALGTLPIQFMWFGDEIRLVASLAAYEGHLGQRLVSVAGLGIPELMERFRGFVSHDNETWYRSQFIQHLNCAEYLAYLGILPAPGAVDMVFEDDQGLETSVAVTPLYGDLSNQAFSVVERMQVPLAQQTQRIYEATELSERALLISYHACQADPDLPMRTFIKQVQALLDAGAYEKVLVDLRYNSGGNSSIFEPMIDMLAKKKQAQGFDLYAMIGENTFSSALMNAVQIQARAGAVLVGQPTGGSVNHYGEIVSFALPNAEVMVTHSTKFFEMIRGHGVDSLQPEAIVQTTYADFIQGRDPQIESILAEAN